ncbi:ImmA/IrrE family metallo-endopeptidase [Micromonospora cathayae]|uniref:EcoRII C terminal n=1 Tax=Micromonospora cathayae TaxID=3028804 RepID=A0ABY7ZU88_9ACTN|nr:hypothetical protein [Micromonospora sp. HUAS 3]WDZ86443.1 hypothetical protein PVK37_08615 [Micromonospora sp. HUAS 3]
MTLVEDRQSASSRRAIACSLYPLAEWITYNWWFLQSGIRSASSTTALRAGRLSGDSNRIWQRHCLRAAGDGFLWPNMFLLPEDSNTRLLWLSDRGHVENRPIRFLTQGETVVDSKGLQQVLGGLVEEVIARLSDLGIESTRLHEEWAAIQETDPEEAAYCFAAARLGLDPYSEAAKYESGILQAADELEAELLNDFLSAVSPEKIVEDLRWVAAAGSEIERMTSTRGGDLEALSAEVLKRTEPGPPTLWRRGYADAQALRRTLGLDSTAFFSFAEYLDEAVVPAPDRGLQAAGGSRDHLSSRVVLGRQQRESSARFTLARALWNILFRPRKRFLVTQGQTTRQKIERAFAAELLAPAEGIAKIIDGPPYEIGMDEFEASEAHFGVSPLIIKHQIENQLTPL